MIVVVDFDNTLALGNKSHISVAIPNYPLIERLRDLKKEVNPYIKIVTARGAKGKLSITEKEKRYKKLIESFLSKYNIPYDEISFNKEYASLYIDDMTIHPSAEFSSFTSSFTGNRVVQTEDTVLKFCTTALFEFEWYKKASLYLDVPEVLFCNDELIITRRVKNFKKPRAKDLVKLLSRFANPMLKIPNYPFYTYKDNIPLGIPYLSQKTKSVIESLPEHRPTFFHGDLSTTNVLKEEDTLFLIDPNYKYIFGSYMTDAGKALFSLAAYEQDMQEALKISEHFGQDVLKFAVAEGLRVCKNKPEYISIVNNIAELT
tara:strand:- start:1961 stop:2911 length:951 start_codon:yes stop_codon:yes gene_type:complete